MVTPDSTLDADTLVGVLSRVPSAQNFLSLDVTEGVVVVSGAWALGKRHL